MNTNIFFDRLSNLVSQADLQKNVPLSRCSSFGVGGCAELFYRPASVEDLAVVLQEACYCGVRTTILGKMTNVIIGDGGISGLTVCMDSLDECIFDEKNVIAQAGARLMSVARKATFDHNLSGMAFAGGIPGSVGGAVIMNAGAYGGEIKDIITHVRYIDKDAFNLHEISVTSQDFGYRNSKFMDMGAIIVGARFELEHADGDDERMRFDELMKKRREKQPVNLPSAGSVFKRPVGHFAGALIEQAGLKGKTVGGAQVSELHAGFIVNIGGATAKDIKSLIHLIQNRVFECSGVMLETEVRMIGEE